MDDSPISFRIPSELRERLDSLPHTFARSVLFRAALARVLDEAERDELVRELMGAQGLTRGSQR